MTDQEQKEKRREQARRRYQREKTERAERRSIRDAYVTKLQPLYDVFPSEEELAPCSDADLEKIFERFQALGRVFYDTKLNEIPGRAEMGHLLFAMSRRVVSVQNDRTFESEMKIRKAISQGGNIVRLHVKKM